MVSRTASYPQTKDRGGKAVISSLYYVTQMRGSGDLETSVFILRLRRYCTLRCPKRVLGGLPSREGLRHSGVADWLIPLSTAMVICTHFLHIFPSRSLIITCRLRKRDVFDESKEYVAWVNLKITTEFFVQCITICKSLNNTHKKLFYGEIIFYSFNLIISSHIIY